MKEKKMPIIFCSHISIPIIAVLLLVMATLPVASAVTTTYDFGSGPGTDKWAYREQCTKKPPLTNSDPNTPFSSGAYNKINANEGTMQENKAGSASYYAAHRFKFTVSENTNSITQIYVFWNGKGKIEGLTLVDGATLYIWNYDSGSYESLDSNSNENEVDLTGTITSNIGNYIDANGYLIILAEQNDKVLLPSGILYSEISTDYVKVDVTTSTTVTSCDINGTEIDQFAPGEKVYAKAEGLAASTSYKIWLQNCTVNGGATLDAGKDESGTQETVTTAPNGSFGYGVGDYPNPVEIWNISLTATVTHHEHDIVVDKQDGGAGTYNAADDGLDSASTAGMVAPVPDVFSLILFASGLMLAAVYFVY